MNIKRTLFDTYWVFVRNNGDLSYGNLGTAPKLYLSKPRCEAANRTHGGKLLGEAVCVKLRVVGE